MTQIQRSGTDVGGAVQYSRSLTYDSLGRLVLNVEPNAGTSQYAYDDLGDLVGTTDARGCGANIVNDGLGRPVSEDYIRCTTFQAPYTPVTDANGTGTEAFRIYETLPGGIITGNIQSLQDRAASVTWGYDARGRLHDVSKKVAKPCATAPCATDPTIVNRYAPSLYVTTLTFDDLDRLRSQTTGATAPELLAPTAALQYELGPSTVWANYTERDILANVQSSYGALIASNAVTVDGRPSLVTYGDVAGTTASYSYDSRLRVTETNVSRLAKNFPSAQEQGYYSACSGH